MEGIPIRGFVDSGSSATIISYNVFEKIGKAAKIPASELHQTNMILRDYSQCTIPVGTAVNLTVSFQGHSITVPVYIQPVDTSQCESCLPGTNVVISCGRPDFGTPSLTPPDSSDGTGSREE